MKVDKHKVVALSYELKVEGRTADKADADRPLEYIHGTGMLLPKFEAELAGKTAGEEFAFTLTPEEGYGAHKPEYRFDIPKKSFEVDGVLREDLLVVGNLIPMLNGSGQVVQGRIEAVGADTVTMDFNHPMAGKTLNFTGKVLSVRDASEKELTEGLHGEYLPPEEHECCHGKGDGCCHKGEGHHHKDGEGCCHKGEGHHHKDGEGCCHEGGGKCCKEEK